MTASGDGISGGHTNGAQCFPPDNSQKNPSNDAASNIPNDHDHSPGQHTPQGQFPPPAGILSQDQADAQRGFFTSASERVEFVQTQKKAVVHIDLTGGDSDSDHQESRPAKKSRLSAYLQEPSTLLEQRIHEDRLQGSSAECVWGTTPIKQEIFTPPQPVSYQLDAGTRYRIEGPEKNHSARQFMRDAVALRGDIYDAELQEECCRRFKPPMRKMMSDIARRSNDKTRLMVSQNDVEDQMGDPAPLEAKKHGVEQRRINVDNEFRQMMSELLDAWNSISSLPGQGGEKSLAPLPTNEHTFFEGNVGQNAGIPHFGGLMSTRPHQTINLTDDEEYLVGDHLNSETKIKSEQMVAANDFINAIMRPEMGQDNNKNEFTRDAHTAEPVGCNVKIEDEGGNMEFHEVAVVQKSMDMINAEPVVSSSSSNIECDEGAKNVEADESMIDAEQPRNDEAEVV